MRVSRTSSTAADAGGKLLKNGQHAPLSVNILPKPSDFSLYLHSPCEGLWLTLFPLARAWNFGPSMVDKRLDSQSSQKGVLGIFHPFQKAEDNLQPAVDLIGKQVCGTLMRDIIFAKCPRDARKEFLLWDKD